LGGIGLRDIRRKGEIAVEAVGIGLNTFHSPFSLSSQKVLEFPPLPNRRSSSSVQHCVDGILNVGGLRLPRFPADGVSISSNKWDIGWNPQSRQVVEKPT
jgi:hypothetical protein